METKQYTNEQQAQTYNGNLRLAVSEANEARGRYKRARSSNGQNKAATDYEQTWLRHLRKFYIGEKKSIRMPQLTLDDFMTWEEAVAVGALLDWNDE